MIQTFDDYVKEQRKKKGIQTFNDYVKENNLKIYSADADTVQKKTNWFSKARKIAKFATNPSRIVTDLATDQAKKGIKVGIKTIEDVKLGKTPIISSPNPELNGAEKSLMTGLNANKLFVENMMKSAEGTIDTGASLVSGVGKIFGANTNKVDDFIKKDLTQNSLDYVLGRGNVAKGRKLQEQLDSNSYITNKDLAGQVVSAVGGQVPTILASGVAKNSGLSDKGIESVNKATFGSKVYGNSMEKALNNGASFKDATKYAVGSSAVEIASEWLTGGIPGTNGKGALDNLAGKLIGEPIDEASKSLSKAILKYGYRMVGEASEEMLSEFLQPFVEQLTYKYDETKTLGGNLKEGLKNVSGEDILIAGITGALSAGILDAPVSFSDISQAKRNKGNTNVKPNTENKADIEQKDKTNTSNSSTSDVAHTSSNVVQNLNNQEENITERLVKIKQLQEVAKQNKKYDKINEVLEKYRNIQETQNQTIQNIENNQNNLIEQTQQQNNLTIDEQNELRALEETDLAMGLDEKENFRLNYLEKKQNGLIKYPDLINKNSYEDIKSNYWNYKNSLKNYDPSLYNKIKEVTPSYRNTGKMTKNEWLGLAKNVGANFKGDSKSLEKYAIQTWFYASPQNNLNRQGKKFVKFDIGEWLTSFYEGAGVGAEINLPTKVNTSNTLTNYSMSNLPMASYNYVESNNAKINELRKSASQYLNSSEKTIRAIDLMEKIIADKDYRIRFNPNITNESGVPVNGLITKENGQVIIELNPNANNYVEFLIVHEITHDIATKDMKELILDYAKLDSEFEKSLETLKERYKTDDVSDEVVADVCGELFGNREFIQSVVEKKPNIFMKILNNIRELAKKIKGSKAEGYVGFVKKLKTMWEDAYYSNESKLSESKFSIQQDSNGNNYVEVDTDQDIFDGIDEKDYNKIAKMYITDYLMGNTKLGNSDKVEINKKTSKKYTNPGKKQENFVEKMKLTPELKNVLEIATLRENSSANKINSKFANWEYYDFEFKLNGKTFKGNINIGITDKGKYLYEINNVKKTSGITGTSLHRPTGFSANNIPQPDNNVNSGTSSTTKYSIPINKNNTQELENSSFYKEWNDYLKENFPSSGTKTKMSDIKLPVREDIESSSKKSKILNPNEISKLTKEDANTTPILPKRESINKVNDGNSHFAKNIKDKVNMLNEEQKSIALSEDDVKFYDKVTNKESLEKAFKKLEKNGASETLEWFNKEPKNANSVDVAEGWILLKQYADNNDALGMKNVAKKLRNIGTAAGQTIQAFNIMERMTPEGMVVYAQSELDEAYDKMVKNKTTEWINKHRSEFDLTPEETQTIMNIMDDVKNMEDGYEKRVKLAEIQKLMTDKLPPERGAGIKAWMRISMLFNPKTQVRNILGNAVIAPTNAFSDLFASGVDKMISKKTNVRTTGAPNLKSYGKGFKTGLYQSYNDFKKGINTRNIEGNRFEITQGKSFNDKNVIGKNLNRVDNLLSFMLDAGDRGFYEASFTNSINNQMILNKTNKITQEMIDIATSEALSRTWQDNNNYTRFVLQTRNALNKINVKGYGLGDILIPFAKTPANLTKAIVDYSPVGLINAINSGINLKNSLENGQFTPQMQHEFVQRLGKATAGTMLYIIGLALAKAGITSGESDDDKDTRNFMKNTLGINSYSIKIGGKTFTYDWAQPIAAPLSITANIEKNRKDNASALENIISSLDTAGSILLEQSFMDSINTVLNNNDGIVTGMQEAILELPSRAIPTFSKQIVDLTDSTQRQTFEYNAPLKTSVNKIKAKIPGLSKQLAPSVDTMGRDIQKYGGKNNVFNVFLNPANVNSENLSESAKEIYRLYKETGETTLMPRVSPYYINKNGEKTILTSEQRADYQKNSGKIIEENVNKLLKNRTYSLLSDEEKTDVVNNLVNYSYNVAQKEVLDFDITKNYRKAYQYSKIGNVSDFYIIKSQEFTSNKDKNGKTISGSKKAKVINYINSMDLPVSQKAVLINLNGYKLTNYNSQVISYVNTSSNSMEDKKEILKSLGFEVYTKNGKTYVK